MFGLADRIFGRSAAIAASAVYALDPLLVIGAGLLYPELVAALLLPPIVLSALNATDQDRLQWSATSGMLLGLLALLRPVALVLPPVVGGWIALEASVPLSRRLAHVVVLALAVLLVLAPWSIRNLRIHADLVPVTTVGSQMVASSDHERASGGLLNGLARELWTNPGSFTSRTVRNFVQFWELAPTRMITDDRDERQKLRELDPRLPAEPLFSRNLRDRVSAVSFSLELSLALVGLVAAARTHRRAILLPLYLILAYAAGYALLVVKLRYRMPVLPLLFLYTGAGGVALYSWLGPRRFRHLFGQDVPSSSLGGASSDPVKASPQENRRE
jgi:4-amino-4-deoxy-L-arabinose transferase-like glycosyltransferase